MNLHMVNDEDQMEQYERLENLKNIALANAFLRGIITTTINIVNEKKNELNVTSCVITFRCITYQ